MILGQSVTLVSTDLSFDPQTGFQYEFVWEGTREAITAITNAYVIAGARARMTNKALKWICNAYIGADQVDGKPEVAVDRWELDSEFYTQDLYLSPKLAAADFTDDDIKLIEAALRATTKKDLDAAEGAFMNQPGFDLTRAVYGQKKRGGTSYEGRRCVLSRVRTITTRYPAQVVVDAVEKVYATPILITTFNIPPNIAARLPADPALKPANTVWGWKPRKQTSQIILALNKVEEVSDWVFAAWFTAAYDIYV